MSTIKVKGLKSLSERLASLEEDLTPPAVSPPPVTPRKKLSSLVKRTMDLKQDNLQVELDKMLEHYKEKIASLTNLFQVVGSTVEYVEKNYIKLSLLFQIHPTSHFKLHSCINLLKENERLELDESLLCELIDYLVSIMYPKEKEEEALEDLFEEPKASMDLKRRHSVSVSKGVKGVSQDELLRRNAQHNKSRFGFHFGRKKNE